VVDGVFPKGQVKFWYGVFQGIIIVCGLGCVNCQLILLHPVLQFL
jgi:hypothetical protein